MNLTEVVLFFNTHLLRGNRAKKVDPWGISAIESPNFEPLATMGVGIDVRATSLIKPSGNLIFYLFGLKDKQIRKKKKNREVVFICMHVDVSLSSFF